MQKKKVTLLNIDSTPEDNISRKKLAQTPIQQFPKNKSISTINVYNAKEDLNHGLLLKFPESKLKPIHSLKHEKYPPQ